MSDDFGSDFDLDADLTPNMDEVAGPANLIQDERHRLETPHGGLLDDRDYGLSLLEFLSRRITALDRGSLARRVQQQLAFDDRVASVDVVSRSVGDWEQLDVTVTTRRGPFRFTVSVDEAGALVVQTTR